MFEILNEMMKYDAGYDSVDDFETVSRRTWGLISQIL
jgi:hypothetical protein